MAFRSACFILIGLQLINSSQAQYAYKITTWSKNGAGEFKERASFFEIYNADSLLVEKRNSRNCDKSCEGTRYEYNEKRQKITETDFYYYSAYKDTFRRNYEYDGSGLLKSMSYRTRNKTGDTTTVTETYFYNDKGQLIEKKSTGWGTAKTTYSYEQKPGRLVVTEIGPGIETMKPIKRVITYNEKGLIIRQADKKIKKVYSYDYGPDGNWTVIKICHKESLSFWFCSEETRRTLITNWSQ